MNFVAASEAAPVLQASTLSWQQAWEHYDIGSAKQPSYGKGCTLYNLSGTRLQQANVSESAECNPVETAELNFRPVCDHNLDASDDDPFFGAEAFES